MGSKASKEFGKKEGCLGWVLATVFTLGGLLALYLTFILPAARILEARSWQPADCIVLTSEVRSHPGSEGDTYSVDITYAYEIDGEEHIGDRYSFASGSSSGYDRKAEIVARYPPDTPILCFVDPDDPSRSVIDRSAGPFLLWGLIPAAFVLAGFGTMFFLARRKSADPAPAPTAPRTFAERRRAREQRLSASGNLEPVETASPRAGEPGTMPQDVRAGSLGDGPVKLRSESNPKTAAIVLGIFALIWNGIVYHVGRPIVEDDAHSLGYLVVVPFLLVGLGLLLLTIHQALATLNPRLELTLSEGLVHLGEPCRVSWKLVGNRQRLKRLELFLEGRESATYRRGTNTTTEHSVFFRQRLVEETRFHFGDGTVTFELPRNTLPTFEAHRNQVQWRLVAKGDIPFWPDVRDAFFFSVVPPRDLEERS